MKTQAIIKHIVDWIINYCSHAGINSLVIGVSGGIDSALTSTLAAKTNLNILCVEIPIHQNKKQMSRATKHINFLKKKYTNVKSIEVQLTPVFNQLIEVLSKDKITKEKEVSLVNTKSRLRMTTLYYFASINNAIVVGTGNKVEDFGIGFFTKYGDGGVDISPIADLNKTEVYSLAKHIGVCKEILDAPPTDGLWGDDRTDEEQIGASYPELEWAMNYRKGEPLSKRKKEILSIYQKLNKSNKHKMEAIPICQIPRDLK